MDGSTKVTLMVLVCIVWVGILYLATKYKGKPDELSINRSIFFIVLWWVSLQEALYFILCQGINPYTDLRW